MNPLHDLARGAIAGLAATLPMTLAMELMKRALPWYEDYAMPPRPIVEEMVDRSGLEPWTGLDSSEEALLTAAAHFAYGAGAAMPYAPIARRLGVPGLAAGPVYGLAVWAASYQGWLPALGILPPASEHPARRTAVMIGAHLVWGAAVGLIEERLRARSAGP